MTVAMIYALIPEALCVLGLLVTMCPVVADELERRASITANHPARALRTHQN